MNHDLLLLSRSQVASLLEGEETAILDLVREAYLLHASGRAVAPQQSLLRLPGQSGNRIIAKPAYLPCRFNAAGVKWVSSFPDNISRAMERASAILVLNSAETGQAELIAEASLINLKRTAASAAIAAGSGRGSIRSFYNASAFRKNVD
jgi:ornithine cyclodeaminase/alanine dehydrogenase-like protein (mu-crystallin family)